MAGRIEIRGANRRERDLQHQLNAGTRVVGLTGKAFPNDLKSGDLTVRPAGNTLNLGFAAGDGLSEFPITKSLTSSSTLTISAAAPALADYPHDGDYGWHKNTNGPFYYYVRNVGGTLIFPNFRSIDGTLRTGQHGDRSAEGGTMHSLSQCSGTLAFTDITGTITDAQHGALTDPLAHDAATGAANGFLSSSDKTKLNNYPADCTATSGDSNAVKRSSGAINASEYQSGGTKVVGAQGAAVADSTLGDVDVKLNVLLARLRTHGLIAT